MIFFFAIGYVFGALTFFPIVIISLIYFFSKVEGDSNKTKEKFKYNNQENDCNPKTTDFFNEYINKGWIYLSELNELQLESLCDLNENKNSININNLDLNYDKKENQSLNDLKLSLKIDNSNEKTFNSTSNKDQRYLSSNDFKEKLNYFSKIKLKNLQKKKKFYAILKPGNLFLYEDTSLKHLKSVINLANFYISFFPSNLSDDKLFTNFTSIALIDCTSNNKFKNIGLNSKVSFLKNCKFIFCDLNIEKEDWYFSLLKSQSFFINQHIDLFDSNVHPNICHLETDLMLKLIQILYNSNSHIQTQWFNAIIGRLFLSLKKTESFKNYLHSQLQQKVNKINKPDFLEDFEIRSINPGFSAPVISFPVIKTISPDGTVVVSVYLTYVGNFSIEIYTTLNLSLGSRFKKREMNLLLNIVLKKLQGHLLLKIKPPPSSRFWYTFENEPILNLSIESSISSKQMTYNIISKTIEKKIKESIKENIVIPHWDDITLFKSENNLYKGGLFFKTNDNDYYNKSDVSSDSTNFEDCLSSNYHEIIDFDKNIFQDQKNFNTTEKKEINLNKMNLKDQKSNPNKLSNYKMVDNSLYGNFISLNSFKSFKRWYFKINNSNIYKTQSGPEMIVNRRNTNQRE